MSDERCALVLEGGAMRGMYTAGVLDCFMDHDISFDAVIGVSAGALFGVNLLSKQRGRVIRYNKRFNSDKNYMGIRPLLREKNIVSTKYAYDTVPRELDQFDDEEYKKSDIPFYAVVTNIRTGKPEYVQILTSSSVEAANLANNHSADYGDVSLSDTIKYLNEAGISNFIGTNTAIRDVNGISVGLVGIDALDETEAAKLENVIGSVKSLGAQLVIVSIHWGEEKATAPNDTQTELAHKAIDAGADLVLGTHPHVLQGIEKYNGKYIAYSLGNFCFGGNNNPADKDTVIYRQTFTFVDGVMQEDDNMTLIPATISGHDEYNDYQPAIAEGDRKTQIENKLIEYSTPLGLSTLNFR